MGDAISLSMNTSNSISMGGGKRTSFRLYRTSYVIETRTKNLVDSSLSTTPYQLSTLSLLFHFVANHYKACDLLFIIMPSIAKRLFLSRNNTSLLAFLTFSTAFQTIPQRSATRYFSHSVRRMMTKQVLVPIGDGSEEIETSCITDTLTRFGAKVTVASVKPDRELLCIMSRGIKIQADEPISDAVAREWDLIVLPGGVAGAEALRDCEPLIHLVKKQKSAGKLYGAICAAPAIVLASHGLIDDEAAATCYPAPRFQETIKNHSDKSVVVEGNMITSQGPGTSIQFALQLGEELFGKEKRNEIAKQMLVE